MSSHKGKAKTKSTAKTAGTKKKAVMNTRNPKKPEAISGDTMSNYAMYKKGGSVKKYKSGGGFPDLTGDGKVTKADILKGRGVIKKKGGNVKKVLPKHQGQSSQVKTQIPGPTIRPRTVEPKNEIPRFIHKQNDSPKLIPRKRKDMDRYRMGIYRDPGKGTFKKGGLTKAQVGIWKKDKTINEDGSSMTRRTSVNPITGNTRQVTKVKSADGDKSRSVRITSRKKGGKVSKYQEGGFTNIPPQMKMNPYKQAVPDKGPKPSYDTMEPSYKKPIPPKMEMAPDIVKKFPSPTSKYTTNESPSIQYRQKKGGSIKKKYQKGGSTTKPTNPYQALGTGSKVDILKNAYKKYIKK